MTSNAPYFCPQCLAANVIATSSGPTCAHRVNAGASWWPEWWPRVTEGERLAWLAKQQANK